jgi:hypothetical protein
MNLQVQVKPATIDYAAIEKSYKKVLREMDANVIAGAVLTLSRVIAREFLHEQPADKCHLRLVDCAASHAARYRDGLAYIAMAQFGK